MANDTNDALKLHKAIPNKILNQDGTYSTFQEVLGGGSSARMQRKSVTITQNGETTVRPDEGYNGLSSAVITTNVPMIDFNAKIDFAAYLDRSYPFRSITEFDIDLNNRNDSFQQVFQGCAQLKKGKLKNAKNITSFYNTFLNCQRLEEIYIDDLSSCTALNSVFENCYKLESLELKNTQSCASFAGMCKNCNTLKDINQFDMSGGNDYHVSTNMVVGCNNLTENSIINIVKSLLTIPDSLDCRRQLAMTGFNATQRTFIQTLPEWTELQAKGWTVGS